MIDDRALYDAEDYVLGSVVDLLDTLLDTAAAAQPGCTAAVYASGLRCLGDSAAEVVADLEVMLQQRPAARQAVA